ncbi:MAG: VOC family protein [Chloroflexi bacterium]|nr:VOC family protein [Chloroflexota bacterium]
MIKGVGHAAIAVSDLQRSLHFYCDILGFRNVRSFDRPDGAHVVDLSKGPSQIGEMQLIKYPPGVYSRSSGSRKFGVEHIAMLVDDMDATYAELRSKGVTEWIKEPGPPRGPGFPRTAHLRDPDGVMIELITFVPDRSDSRP